MVLGLLPCDSWETSVLCPFSACSVGVGLFTHKFPTSSSERVTGNLTYRGNHSNRFLILEQTTERLIQQYGPSGIIYLNDYKEPELDKAIAHLEKWLADHHYTKIKLVRLPGDYTKSVTTHMIGGGFPIGNRKETRLSMSYPEYIRWISSVGTPHQAKGVQQRMSKAVASFFWRADEIAAKWPSFVPVANLGDSLARSSARSLVRDTAR